MRPISLVHSLSIIIMIIIIIIIIIIIMFSTSVNTAFFLCVGPGVSER